MKKILILIPYYIPGFKSGGPQQTIKNLTELFGYQVNIYIYTQNCDLDERIPYENIETEKWIKVGNANVMYEKPELYCGKTMEKLYNEFRVIYSCGLFEKNSIAILTIHKKYKQSEKKIYIAPMGVFSPGALKAKKIKKKLFLYLFRYMGCFDNIIWSFTSWLEIEDARKVLGNKLKNNYIIAEDLPRKIDFEKQEQILKKRKFDSKIKIVFLSRICPQKNLLMCFDVLKNINESVVFDIYGTIEDQKYWNKCLEEKKLLSEKIVVNYQGNVRPETVIDILTKYDIFLLPTKGENYGHVIYESLAAGCFAVISDTTPWMDIEKNNCGKICNLDKLEDFSEAIRHYISSSPKERLEMHINAIRYAKNKNENALKGSGYLKIWEE